MADPASLTSLGTGASVGGGLLGGLGKIMGGQSQGSMYAYQSGMARINADIAKQNASYARYTGEVEAQRQGMKTRNEVGTAKVVQSGRGFDVNSGTAGDVRESIGDIGRQDQATIRANSARRAYAFDVEGIKQTTQSRVLGHAAESSRTAGLIEGFGSLLSTVGSVSSRWLQASTAGVGSGQGISLGPSPDFPPAMDWAEG